MPQEASQEQRHYRCTSGMPLLPSLANVLLLFKRQCASPKSIACPAKQGGDLFLIYIFFLVLKIIAQKKCPCGS